MPSDGGNTVTVATLAGEFSCIDGEAGNDRITGGAVNAATLAGRRLRRQQAGLQRRRQHAARGLAANAVLQGGLGRELLSGGDGSAIFIFIFNARDSPEPPRRWPTTH